MIKSGSAAQWKLIANQKMLMATRPPKERRATGTPIDRLLVVASSGVSADMTGPLPHHREGGYARRSWGEYTTHELACLRWMWVLGTGPPQPSPSPFSPVS